MPKEEILSRWQEFASKPKYLVYPSLSRQRIILSLQANGFTCFVGCRCQLRKCNF